MKPIQHWNCLSCKTYNDVLHNHCRFCKADKPSWVTSLYQIGVELDRGIYFGYGVYGIDYFFNRSRRDESENETMTPQEELFARFYNHEKVLVKDMDVVQLREHREELQKIAFEAKARLVAADDEARERKAKTSNKEWLVTDAKPDYDVSSAINVVKKRAERMSKMDKLTEQLKKAGIDDATIREMVGNLEKKATDSKLKTVTFHKPADEIAVVQVKVEKNNEPKEPFNPLSLGFACSKCKQNPCRCDGLQPVRA